jgi:tetratricopeptide (TPR) repeat protein
MIEAPKYEKAFEALYTFYLNKKNYYDARLILLEMIEKFGEKAKWLNQLCDMEIREKFFDSAKNVCQSALVKSPNVPENHVNLALAFKYTEAEDQSRKILFAAAKQFQNSEYTQREAGFASQTVKNYELSEIHFSRCGKLNPRAGGCWLGLAKAQFQLKKYEPALESFMKACPYLKEAELEIRRHAYDLDKLGQSKLYKKYMDLTDKCRSAWFSEAKKSQK